MSHPMRYIKPTALKDCPQVGCLYQAREWKRKAWRGIQETRRRMRDELAKPIGCRNIVTAKLAMMKAEDFHRMATNAERECLDLIEKRANELGMTTKRAVQAA